MDAKHTPTPYHADREIITDQHGKEVARTNHTIRIEAYANAEFIIRACNSHEALVEALQDLLTWPALAHCADTRVAQAREALAAAGVNV